MELQCPPKEIDPVEVMHVDQENHQVRREVLNINQTTQRSYEQSEQRGNVMIGGSFVVVPVIYSGQQMRRRDEQTFHRGGAVVDHQRVGKYHFWLSFQR